jgi:glycosyltransferase involved in cell wall biosynthesis
MNKQPYFSIGVTTYKRNDLLIQCLNSILAQSFKNFEVIVGNDYQAEAVTGKILGITDKRIKYINYESNLGEFRNLNKLLELSSGRYFTWLADDDLLLPECFAYYFRALEENNYPQCAFSKFSFKHDFLGVLDDLEKDNYSCKVFSGREFLRKALTREIWPIATMGMYERNYLSDNGGFQNITKQNDMPGMYGEYMLLIKAGLLKEVPFVDVPLSAFRIHGDSWSTNNNDSELIREANKNFFTAACKELQQPELVDDFSGNIRQIIEICLYNFGISMFRAGYGIIKTIKNLAASYSDLNSNNNIKRPFAKALCRISINILWTKLKMISGKKL